MTPAQAKTRWDELMASRPAPVPMPPTPTLDNLRKLRLAMDQAREALASLGVRGDNLTLGEVNSLLAMVSAA
jgi:hypothetical protein